MFNYLASQYYSRAVQATGVSISLSIQICVSKNNTCGISMNGRMPEIVP